MRLIFYVIAMMIVNEVSANAEYFCGPQNSSFVHRLSKWFTSFCSQDESNHIFPELKAVVEASHCGLVWIFGKSFKCSIGNQSEENSTPASILTTLPSTESPITTVPAQLAAINPPSNQPPSNVPYGGQFPPQGPPPPGPRYEQNYRFSPFGGPPLGSQFQGPPFYRPPGPPFYPPYQGPYDPPLRSKRSFDHLIL
ncbi:unnamed protein product [Anisakis simplex]|uniref:Uncharacterized protein n=1 Tax=Anisakis simplex TaxID=6269 RepID=A0A0M3KAD6_ANISI|nr:unnamed protein product [Anisakis simplex]